MPAKNILVTGGAGFIGSHTVVELASQGYRPVIVDNFVNSSKTVIDQLQRLIGTKVTYYEVDYSNSTKLRQVIEKEQISGVIHFAAYKAVNESIQEPLKYYDNNVAGFVGLLDICEQAGISQLVFSSSATVYGEADTLPVTEQSPVKPAESPYGATKQMCEVILRDVTAASKQLRSIALRYFNPIGAHPSSLIGELPLGVPANLVPFVVQVAAGIRDQLTVYGDDYPTPDGSCIRDYIHVVDLAKAHVQALRFLAEQQAASYEACNVGTGVGSSVLEVLKTFEQVTGQKVPYIVGARRPGDVMQSYASVNKAGELLGWKAEHTLADALADAWRWQERLKEAK